MNIGIVEIQIISSLRTIWIVSKYILPKLLVNTKENESTVILRLFALLSLQLRRFVPPEILHLILVAQLLQQQMVYQMVTRIAKMDRHWDLKKKTTQVWIVAQLNVHRQEGEIQTGIALLNHHQSPEPGQVHD